MRSVAAAKAAVEGGGRGGGGGGGGGLAAAAAYRQSDDFAPAAPLLTAQLLVPLFLIGLAVKLGVALGVAVPLGSRRPPPPPPPPPTSIRVATAGVVVSNDDDVVDVGGAFVDDFCRDYAARFVDGNCYALLKRGPCPPLHWLTVDPQLLAVNKKQSNFVDRSSFFTFLPFRLTPSDVHDNTHETQTC